jgi:formate dehydrogenase subunit gamma
MFSFSSLRRGAVLVCALTLAASVLAEVPNRSAKPASPEEQTIMQTERNSPEKGFDSTASGKVHMDRHYLGQYGATEGTVILQRGGNTWRLLRNGPMATTAGFLLLATPLVLLGVYLGVGPGRKHESGRRLERFNRWQRWVHWSTAYSFIALALTGVIILFGKNVLLPWMGNDVFYWVAMISKWIHNFVGPLFIVCSILMFVAFVRENAFRRWDWQWIKTVGGLFSRKGKEIPAGYFNAGEKIWFWGAVVLLGLLMSVTGLVLDFVNFDQTRYVLQIADYLHLGGATLYMAGAMGHIYLGTVGSPGSYEAMRHGTVDAAWAKEHHGIWYEEVTHNASPPTPPRRQ